MSELPDIFDAQARARFLRDLAALGAGPLPIAEAALALASIDRPRVDLKRYREHLRLLVRDVGRHAGEAAELAARGRALNEIILLKHGYAGDELTYDDLQNANLIRVIDRRKGLPVVLGILYIHAARAQGWDIAGLGFPGHFLVRLELAAERLILDPFHGGRTCTAAELRELLKATAGEARELTPEHYAAVCDRDVLLRLQNNLKARQMQGQHWERALSTVETMLLLAPDQADLWREAGALQARLGNLRAAVASFEGYIARTPDSVARYQAAAVVQQLKAKMN